MRNLGVTSVIVSHVPEPLVGPLVVLTFFGSPTFLAVATPVSAWLGYRHGFLTRRNAIRVLLMAAIAIATSAVLKAAFALPRPPVDLWLVSEDGFGFPSGHALVTTAVTGSFTALGRRPDRRIAVGVATVFSLGIAATRLLLGVHYLIDVLAGIGIGLFVVGIGLPITDRALR